MNQLQLKGYVHNVTSPTPSRKGTSTYFNFSFQVDESRKRRAVCFDTTKQQVLKRYQDAKQPVHLLDVKQKQSRLDPSQEDIILSKKSRIEPTTTSSMAFKYDDTTPAANDQTLTSISDIPSLDENHLTTVKGILTLDTESIREKPMNDGYLLPMMDRCLITDNTGSIPLTLWGDTIKQAVNAHCYTITDVRVKLYDSAKYLTTTPNTSITPTEEQFPSPTRDEFNSFFDAKIIHVDQIRLADTYTTWLSCNQCRSQLPKDASPTSTILKCSNCSAAQPISSCSTSGSVRIAVRDSNYELVWLKVFATLLEEMLNQSSNPLTLNSTEEQIYEELFKLRNFTVSYSKTSNIVKNINFNSH